MSCMIGPPFVFLSTLSLRRATRYGRPIDVQLVFLSTLSLRRATVPHVYIPGHRWISIHALLAESDSCPPARPFHCHDFYPRSPCGERHVNPMFAKSLFSISIHALLAESDHKSNGSRCTSPQFLSTLSLRRATVWIPLDDGSLFISIHALLAESDAFHSFSLNRTNYFYPRSPCGERL